MLAWRLGSDAFEFDGFFRMMRFKSRRHFGACGGDEQNEWNSAILSHLRAVRQQRNRAARPDCERGGAASLRCRFGAGRCRKICRIAAPADRLGRLPTSSSSCVFPTSHVFCSMTAAKSWLRRRSDEGAADIPIFILGTVFGILLHQREQIVLHASAVRVNGKAVLFCGSSGAGKSTLAAALSQRGYPLVNDDFCTVTANTAGAPLVHPDGRQLKLWAQAIDRLDLAQSRGERVRKSLEKFYVEPGEVFTEPLVLGAVYALREARPPHVPGIEKPNVVDAALLLRRNAYRPLLVRRLGQRANYFHAATMIANACRNFPSDPDARFRQDAGSRSLRSNGIGTTSRLMEKAA